MSSGQEQHSRHPPPVREPPLSEDELWRRDQAALTGTNLNNAPVPEWVFVPVNRGEQADIPVDNLYVNDIQDNGPMNVNNVVSIDDVTEQTAQTNEYLALRTRLQAESLRSNEAVADAEAVAAANEFAARARQPGFGLNDSMTRVEQTARTSQQTQASMSRYRPDRPVQLNETVEQAFERWYEQIALRNPNRQAQIDQRQHDMEAAQQHANTDTDTDSDEAPSPNASVSTPAPAISQVSSARRNREIEHALRDYRIARNSLTDRGAPLFPEVLRHPAFVDYIRHEAGISNQPPSNALDRTDAVEVNIFGDASVISSPPLAARLQSRIDGTFNQLQDAMDNTQIAKSGTRSFKDKAKNIIKYLSGLKKLDNDREKAINLAKKLEIHSLADGLNQGAEIDLPLRVNDLPEPKPSTWLVAGMSWEGVQRGGFAKVDQLPFDLREGNTTFEAQFGNLPGSARRHDLPAEYRLLRSRERNRLQRRERQRLLTAQGPMVLAREEPQSLLTGFTDMYMDTIAHVESRLNDLLHEEQERLVRDGNDDWRVAGVTFRPRREDETNDTINKEAEGNWPVKVILHEVNMETKTVIGSMVASQIPTRVATAVAPLRPSADASSNNGQEGTDTFLGMTTYFDGEIIDFRNFELETVREKPGYTVGGVGTDLKYWSRIGPFQEEARHKLEAARDAKATEAYAKLGLTGTLDEQREAYRVAFNKEFTNAEELDYDEASIALYNTMIECLSSRKWLDKAMGEGGWIFMRWKERCFLGDPPSGPPTSSSTDDTTAAGQTHVPAPAFPGFYTTSYTDQTHFSRQNDLDRYRGAWGLTIRGFYYVALNRLSGKIEALYFDTGSRPYQELACHPVGTKIEKVETDSGDHIEIGIKREFPSFEFR